MRRSKGWQCPKHRTGEDRRRRSRQLKGDEGRGQLINRALAHGCCPKADVRTCPPFRVRSPQIPSESPVPSSQSPSPQMQMRRRAVCMARARRFCKSKRVWSRSINHFSIASIVWNSNLAPLSTSSILTRRTRSHPSRCRCKYPQVEAVAKSHSPTCSVHNACN